MMIPVTIRNRFSAATLKLRNNNEKLQKFSTTIKIKNHKINTSYVRPGL